MLLLLPNLLGDHKHHEIFLPASVDRAVATLDGLLAESESGARRFLSRFKTQKPTNDIPVGVINGDMSDADLDFFLEPLKKGERWGLISDAGLPAVADPGALVVRRARQLGIPVQAFVGPSSVMLSLMLSGMQGQRFAFNGYIARDEATRARELKKLEKVSKEQDSTQIFIEAPYRNIHTLEAALATLSDKTWLCVAWDLTMPTQGILSQPVSTWKKLPMPNILKKPAIFLIYAQ